MYIMFDMMYLLSVEHCMLRNETHGDVCLPRLILRWHRVVGKQTACTRRPVHRSPSLKSFQQKVSKEVIFFYPSPNGDQLEFT